MTAAGRCHGARRHSVALGPLRQRSRGSAMGWCVSVAMAVVCGTFLADAAGQSVFMGAARQSLRSAVTRVPMGASTVPENPSKPAPAPRRQENPKDVSKSLRDELQGLAKSLGAETTASDAGLVSLIRAKVAGLKALAETKPVEADPLAEARVEELEARLKYMQIMVTDAEKTAFDAETRAEGCEVELFYPINSELNRTKTDLREATAAAAKAEARVEELEASLAAAKDRVATLREGMNQIGGQVGVGGFLGGAVLNILGDKDLVNDIKGKIIDLKKVR